MQKNEIKKLVSEFMAESGKAEQAAMAGGDLLKSFEQTRLTMLADFGKRIGNKATADDVSEIAAGIVAECGKLTPNHKRYISDKSAKSARSDLVVYINVGRTNKADAVNKAVDKALENLEADGIERRRPNVYKSIARKMCRPDDPMAANDAINDYITTVTESETNKAKKVKEFKDLHEFHQIAKTTKTTLERLLKQYKVSEADRKHFRPIVDALDAFLELDPATFNPAPEPAAETGKEVAASDLASVVSAIDMNNPLAQLLVAALTKK